jgi:small neutral amino acid transporter SnatA (MarC family)
MMGKTQSIGIFSVICVGLLAAGGIVNYFVQDFTSLLIAIGAISILTFFHLLRENNSDKSRSLSMRNAIAGTFVLSYILLVISFCFHMLFETSRGIPEITDELVKSFSALVGSIVAFYFGASVAADFLSEKKSKSAEEKDQE